MIESPYQPRNQWPPKIRRNACSVSMLTAHETHLLNTPGFTLIPPVLPPATMVTLREELPQPLHRSLRQDIFIVPYG